MARINVATLGIDLIGEFVVEAQLKIFGPHGTVERADNHVGIELHRRGREYAGRLPQRRLLEWRGGVLQILWKIAYHFDDSDYRGRGSGNILQDWKISPLSETRPMVPVPNITNRPLPRPTLTYKVRPEQRLANVHNENFVVAIDVCHQDIPNGGNCGEITSWLSLGFGESQSDRVTITVQPQGVGSQYSSELATSKGGSFACKVVVPYTS